MVRGFSGYAKTSTHLNERGVSPQAIYFLMVNPYFGECVECGSHLFEGTPACLFQWYTLKCFILHDNR